MTQRQARTITILIWVIAVSVVALVLLTAVIAWATVNHNPSQAYGGPPTPTERTITRNDSLLLFFALFWTVGFVPLAKYRLFETHGLKGARLKRLGVGLLLADFVPVLILAACLAWLPNWTLHVPGGVFSPAAAALSLIVGVAGLAATRRGGGAGEIRTREPSYPGYGISSAAPSTGLGDRSAPVDSIRRVQPQPSSSAGVPDRHPAPDRTGSPQRARPRRPRASVSEARRR